MNFMDGLLLTLVNTVVCITLPAVLSVVTSENKTQKPSSPNIESREPEISGAMDAA